MRRAASACVLVFYLIPLAVPALHPHEVLPPCAPCAGDPGNAPVIASYCDADHPCPDPSHRHHRHPPAHPVRCLLCAAGQLVALPPATPDALRLATTSRAAMPSATPLASRDLPAIPARGPPAHPAV